VIGEDAMPIITRRKWLAGIGAVTVASAVSKATEHSSSERDFVDAHVHVWTPGRRKYPRSGPDRKLEYQPLSFTPEELFANCRPNGVGRVVLIQMNFFGYDNSFMLDAIAKYKDTFRGVAVVDDAEANVRSEMRRLASLGVRGFRIVSGKHSETWLDSAGMSSLWKCAADQSLAICTLVDPEALKSVGRMCEKFPDTRVVIDHLARIGMDGQVRDSDLAALCSLAKHKHVFVKLSAFYALGKKHYPYTDLAGMIRRVYEAFGASRLMWGSDSPFQLQDGNSYSGSLELIRDRLQFFSDDDRRWILQRTASKLFFDS
jgi:predicted TIM-barrel fold metal-dependent hydrolase